MKIVSNRIGSLHLPFALVILVNAYAAPVIEGKRLGVFHFVTTEGEEFSLSRKEHYHNSSAMPYESTFVFGNNHLNFQMIISENTRQMSTALDAAGKRVFTAYATKLNAMNNVVILDRNGNAVPHAYNPADPTIYHQIDKPLIFIKRPGSDSQYFLFTQVSSAGSDFLYSHTLDVSRPGNGSWENPLGEILETNHLMLTNNNALRYGTSVQAIQNAGSSNATWMYFLRSSDTQVQLTGKVLNSDGSFGSSFDLGPVNGKAIGRIKFSPDGTQMMFAYLPPAMLNQAQYALIRRYNIGPNGELALMETKSVSRSLLDFEISPDGRYLYYGIAITETPRLQLKGNGITQPGNKFQVRRLDLTTQTDEFIGNSYNDEIFNGKHLAIQRSANGRMYISAAGHRRMMVINDPGSASVPALTGEVVGDNDPSKAPYLSGAFATVAFDHHFHTVKGNGMFYTHRNQRQYELNDHLGNVTAVVSDMRASNGSVDVVSANNYYPFGMIMPGRNYNNADYRYGFNGMEKEDEIKGAGNSYDFGGRLYDPRIGRWLTRDPLAQENVDMSPYVGMDNNPILMIDPDGKNAVATVDHQKREILISSTIYIWNFGDTRRKARRQAEIMEEGIMKYWGKDFKVYDHKTKSYYKVKFEVNVVPTADMPDRPFERGENSVWLDPPGEKPGEFFGPHAPDVGYVSDHDNSYGRWPSFTAPHMEEGGKVDIDVIWAHEYGHFLMVAHPHEDDESYDWDDLMISETFDRYSHVRDGLVKEMGRFVLKADRLRGSIPGNEIYLDQISMGFNRYFGRKYRRPREYFWTDDEQFADEINRTLQKHESNQSVPIPK